MVNLTDEQRAALVESPDGVLCEDSVTHRVYCLVDRELHEKAMQALKQQQDLEAIRRGLADAEAVAGTRVNDARRELAEELGFSESESS